MGIMTISIPQPVESEFRAFVKQNLGTGKGKLGKAITEAIEEWLEKRKAQDTAKRAIELMEKGIDFGGYKFDREDIYKDRIGY